MTIPPTAVTFVLEPLPNTHGLRLSARRDQQALSYRDWLTHLLQDAQVRASFSKLLANLPLAAFAWECRAVRATNLDQPLDMVAIASPELERAKPDAAAFTAQLACAGDAPVVCFPNLSGDAQLIVPTRRGAEDYYMHLASFVRSACLEQQHAFWVEVAHRTLAKLAGSTTTLWVSTAGLGVSWLHVRLDEHPKYYRHAPFRDA